MAQPLIRAFLAELARAIELPDPVVEFGALQVEPDQDGELRPLFAGRLFTGTDGPSCSAWADWASPATARAAPRCGLDTLEPCEDPRPLAGSWRAGPRATAGSA